MRKYPKIVDGILGTAWAILPEKLNEILAFINVRLEGCIYSEEEVAEKVGRVATKAKNIKGNIAILPIQGVISQKMGSLHHISGGTSTEEFGAWFDAAVADPSIGAIVFDVNSAGGNVYGVPELAAKIRAASGRKPVIAVANAMMASAAYWISSAADEIVVTPSGEAGSIGVLAVHTDTSVAEEKAGIKTTVLKAGKYKALGHPHEPLSDEAANQLQTRVDEYYDMFVGDVSVGRGYTKKEVMAGFGQGKMVGADEAVENGLADRVATMQQVILRLAGSDSKAKPAARKSRAKLESIRHKN